jgi:hypothetical protein
MVLESGGGGGEGFRGVAVGGRRGGGAGGGSEVDSCWMWMLTNPCVRRLMRRFCGRGRAGSAASEDVAGAGLRAMRCAACV